MLLSELERIVESMKIFKKYHPDPLVSPVVAASKEIQVQEVEFENISEEDRNYLLSVGWKTNGFFLWTY